MAEFTPEELQAQVNWMHPELRAAMMAECEEQILNAMHELELGAGWKVPVQAMYRNPHTGEHKVFALDPERVEGLIAGIREAYKKRGDWGTLRHMHTHIEQEIAQQREHLLEQARTLHTLLRGDDVRKVAEQAARAALAQVVRRQLFHVDNLPLGVGLKAAVDDIERMAVEETVSAVAAANRAKPGQ